MGLIKWLFGMNLSEEDIEHNRQIDEAQKWLQNAHQYYKFKFGKSGTDMEAGTAYQKFLREEEKEWNLADKRRKLSEEIAWNNKINANKNIENNLKFKSLSLKQNKNITLTKEEIEFMNNYNNKNLDNNNNNNNNNNNPNSNDQNKSKFELELAIKQKELELLKLRAQMEKEKN